MDQALKVLLAHKTQQAKKKVIAMRNVLNAVEYTPPTLYVVEDKMVEVTDVQEPVKHPLLSWSGIKALVVKLILAN
jgi:hypothetical protein